MPASAEVMLFKAPQKGRLPEREVVEGFDPDQYPGDGPYLTTDKELAREYQRSYENGLQVFYMPQDVFESLLGRRIILRDAVIKDRPSFHVPADGLATFNDAIKQGTPNVYMPQHVG